jgi:hypothetical protein
LKKAERAYKLKSLLPSSASWDIELCNHISFQ